MGHFLSGVRINTNISFLDTNYLKQFSGCACTLIVQKYFVNKYLNEKYHSHKSLNSIKAVSFIGLISTEVTLNYCVGAIAAHTMLVSVALSLSLLKKSHAILPTSSDLMQSQNLLCLSHFSQSPSAIPLSISSLPVPRFASEAAPDEKKAEEVPSDENNEDIERFLSTLESQESTHNIPSLNNFYQISSVIPTSISSLLDLDFASEAAPDEKKAEECFPDSIIGNAIDNNIPIVKKKKRRVKKNKTTKPLSKPKVNLNFKKYRYGMLPGLYFTRHPYPIETRINLDKIVLDDYLPPVISDVVLDFCEPDDLMTLVMMHHYSDRLAVRVGKIFWRVKEALILVVVKEYSNKNLLFVKRLIWLANTCSSDPKELYQALAEKSISLGALFLREINRFSDKFIILPSINQDTIIKIIKKAPSSLKEIDGDVRQLNTALIALGKNPKKGAIATLSLRFLPSEKSFSSFLNSESGQYLQSLVFTDIRNHESDKYLKALESKYYSMHPVIKVLLDSKAWQNIEFLRFVGCPEIKDEFIIPLFTNTNVEQLTFLSIRACCITNKTFFAVVKSYMPNLAYLEFEEVRVEAEGLTALAQNKNFQFLERIVLDNCHLDDSKFIPFINQLNLPNLKILNIMDNQKLTDLSLEALGSCRGLPNLEELYFQIKHDNFTVKGIIGLIRTPFGKKLKKIYIVGCVGDYTVTSPIDDERITAAISATHFFCEESQTYKKRS